MLASFQKTLAFISLASLTVTTLFIAPGLAYDPFNVTKLLSLGAFTGALLIALLLGIKHKWFSTYKTPLLAITLFFASLTLTLLIAAPSVVAQFYGAAGRNTGYLAYVALLVHLFIAVIAATSNNLTRFIYLLFGVSLVSSIYGFIQVFGGEPTSISNPSNFAFGFFGNQNFQSAFTAIAVSAAVSILISQSISIAHRGLILIFVVFSIAQIYVTKSEQGFFVLVASFVILAYLRFVRPLKVQWKISYALFSLVGFIAVLLGTLNKGFLAKYLYQESVTFRGDYWRAGQKMTIENPIFGVGLDGYGDWYRRSRTLEATLRRGPDIFSTSAHNQLFDISSNGGLLLLSAYLFLLGLAVRAVIRVLRRENGYNWKFTAIFIGWFTYQLQSLISVNQLGLGIWGWTLTGLLIGYEINTRAALQSAGNPLERTSGLTLKTSSEKVTVDRDILLFSLFGLIIGAIIAMAPFRNSVELRQLSIETTLVQLDDLTMRSTLNPEISVFIAQNLVANRFEENALKIIRNTVKKYPDNYFAWKLFSSISSATPEEIAQAQLQMKRLDPLNPELK
jgi:O-antigen ligase